MVRDRAHDCVLARPAGCDLPIHLLSLARQAADVTSASHTTSSSSVDCKTKCSNSVDCQASRARARPGPVL
ncbi:hypothetical protein BaRGS_00014105 [Batillaria attramentaria]|uniref:Uncharacterized protein n=1 Tax=Batillaria attramentaria TaxID=370345 RepID=A0ABD0L5T6_9CAEN